MSLDKLFSLIEKGGSGSGNFGHEGIPGHLGGSVPEGGRTITLSFAKTKKYEESLAKIKRWGSMDWKTAPSMLKKAAQEKGFKYPSQTSFNYFGGNSNKVQISDASYRIPTVTLTIEELKKYV